MSKIVFKYPTVLSFKASIASSIFAFYSFEDKKDNKFIFGQNKLDSYLTPIKVGESVLRTTIANHTDKVAEALAKGGQNIQTIEKATLPPTSDTLVIKGSVRFFNNSLSPEATNEVDFKNVFKQYIDLFKNKIGYRLLAERYFMNLINGQILWRNKYGEVETFISIEGENFSEVFSVDDIEGEDNLSVNSLKKEKQEKALEAINRIDKAFTSDQYVTFNVSAKVKLGIGQTVYPSQEFDEEKKISRVLAKSHYVYKGENISQAIFHEQKIGNAIRTIDTWYQKDADFPLAIEPYGIYQKEVKPYRANNTEKNDFYSYFMKIDKLIDELQDPMFSLENIDTINKNLFVVACLIRGGVYSGPSEKKKGKDAEKDANNE